jgi:hypothetical protein
LGAQSISSLYIFFCCFCPVEEEEGEGGRGGLRGVMLAAGSAIEFSRSLRSLEVAFCAAVGK